MRRERTSMGSMKTLLAAVAALGLLVSSGPARAATQQVAGTVVVPLLWEGCGGFVDALLTTAARADTHYHFAVKPATRGKTFVLTPTAPADLDIRFRVGASWAWIHHRAFGAESGTVPAGATEAAVCLYAGPPTTFTYAAG